MYCKRRSQKLQTCCNKNIRDEAKEKSHNPQKRNYLNDIVLFCLSFLGFFILHNNRSLSKNLFLSCFILFTHLFALIKVISHAWPQNQIYKSYTIRILVGVLTYHKIQMVLGNLPIDTLVIPKEVQEENQCLLKFQSSRCVILFHFFQHQQ